MAFVEGEIDFPDEADVPDVLAHRAYAPLETARTDMQHSLDQGHQGEAIRNGLDIAIIGPPNAGKSTLLNRLAGREAAIVSDRAGTTRDIIDIHLNIAGLPLRISDTAGLRDSKDAIESEGVKRASQKAMEANFRIALIDGNLSNPTFDWANLIKEGDFLLVNKMDDDQPIPTDINLPPLPKFTSVFYVSALTGRGVGEFQDAFEQAIIARFPVSHSAGLTRVRHRDCVGRAAQAVSRAQSQLTKAPELAGEDIRTALHAIKELAGEANIEAVLDRIFSRFCIGK